MKRILAFIMVLMLLISATACGGAEEETIVGKWKTSIDLTEYMDNQVQDAEMKKFIKIEDFDLVYYFTFEEDGTYFAECDDAESEKTFEKARNEFMEGARNYLQSQIDLGGGGTTVDELLALSGTTLEALVDRIFSKEAVNIVDKSVVLEGEYKVEGDKLFIKPSTDADFNADQYCTFSLKKDKLTIKEGTSQLVSSDEFEFFPLTLKRA